MKRTTDEWRAVKPESVIETQDTRHILRMLEDMRADLLELGRAAESARALLEIRKGEVVL